MIYLIEDLLNDPKNESRVRELLDFSRDIGFESDFRKPQEIESELEALGEDKILDAYRKGLFRQ